MCQCNRWLSLCKIILKATKTFGYQNVMCLPYNMLNGTKYLFGRQKFLRANENNIVKVPCWATFCFMDSWDWQKYFALTEAFKQDSYRSRTPSVKFLSLDFRQCNDFIYIVVLWNTQLERQLLIHPHSFTFMHTFIPSLHQARHLQMTSLKLNIPLELRNFSLTQSKDSLLIY